MSYQIMVNPLRGKGLKSIEHMAFGDVVTDAKAAQLLFERCPVRHTTELRTMPQLAQACGVQSLHLKLEDTRMGLGSFKALGAVHAIAKQAAATSVDDISKALSGVTYICASAGNHGLSVAAGAKLFGARAVVLLAETVPEGFADRLREKGAEVVRAGADYEDSMAVSKTMADENGWQLLSDGSWEGYADPPRDVMEGYLIMGHEVADQMGAPPTHVFLQAGVGGLAAACAASARVRWGDGVTIVVVEPEAAPALLESVRASRSVDTTGPVSTMGRLDCKTPSHLALKYLAKEADAFATLDDHLVQKSVDWLNDHSIATSPSGGAGFAALHHADLASETERPFGLNETSRVLCYISEGPA